MWLLCEQACALGVAAAGTYTNLVTGFGGMLGMLGFVICASWLASLQPTPSNLNKRCGFAAVSYSGAYLAWCLAGSIQAKAGCLESGAIALAARATVSRVRLAWQNAERCVRAHRYLLLGGAAFSQGATLGPLVGAVLAINPALLLTAFAGTAAIFACFSVSAMLSQRRSWMYLGGTLSSVRTLQWLFQSHIIPSGCRVQLCCLLVVISLAGSPRVLFLFQL